MACTASAVVMQAQLQAWPAEGRRQASCKPGAGDRLPLQLMRCAACLKSHLSSESLSSLDASLGLRKRVASQVASQGESLGASLAGGRLLLLLLMRCADRHRAACAAKLFKRLDASLARRR